MPGCNQIPVAAWQQLEGATWRKLTKVDFRQRLGFSGTCWSVLGSSGGDGFDGGCEGDVGTVRDFKVADTQAQPFQGKLVVGDDVFDKSSRSSRFFRHSFLTQCRPRCFDKESKGIEAAAGLLAALARCPELQDATHCTPKARAMMRMWTMVTDNDDLVVVRWRVYCLSCMFVF